MSTQPPVLGKAELTAMVAMMFATIALSIDAMLPAFPAIAEELTKTDPNKAQLVLTSFILGMGLGIFFSGPLSDAFGRRRVILVGAVLYGLAALLAVISSSLEMLIVSRFLMGIGAAGPRVAALALVRDRFKGREMAQIMSYVMMIFMLVPAIAPSLGAAILTFGSWRAIFASFILFAIGILVWTGLRLPETLAKEHRRPLSLRALRHASVEILRHPSARIAIFVQTLCLGILFSMITTVQPVYDVIYERAETFPLWFGLTALIAGSGSLLNGLLVARLGMRRIAATSLWSQVGFSGVMVALAFVLPAAQVPFFTFVIWQCTVFFMVGTTMGNLNAIAMEPMGHIAGLAASVIGAISTVGAVLIAGPLGQLFDGSLRPLAGGVLLLALLSCYLMRRLAVAEAQIAPAT